MAYEFTVPPFVIDDMVAQMRANFLSMTTPPTPQMRAWYDHCSANERSVKIDYPHSVEDSIAALRDAAQGLQFASVSWGDEMDGPEVTGYVEGVLCLHPDKDCGLLLGHPGAHDGQRIHHFPRASA